MLAYKDKQKKDFTLRRAALVTVVLMLVLAWIKPTYVMILLPGILLSITILGLSIVLERNMPKRPASPPPMQMTRRDDEMEGGVPYNTRSDGRQRR